MWSWNLKEGRAKQGWFWEIIEWTLLFVSSVEDLAGMVNPFGYTLKILIQVIFISPLGTIAKATIMFCMSSNCFSSGLFALPGVCLHHIS